MGLGVKRLYSAAQQRREAVMGVITDELRSRIELALAPSRLEIIDESAGHRGHSGHNPAGESHLRVIIWAAAFDGMSRVERTRSVLSAAGDLVHSGRIHALSIEARAD